MRSPYLQQILRKMRGVRYTERKPAELVRRLRQRLEIDLALIDVDVETMHDGALPNEPPSKGSCARPEPARRPKLSRNRNTARQRSLPKRSVAAELRADDSRICPTQSPPHRRCEQATTCERQREAESIDHVDTSPRRGNVEVTPPNRSIPATGPHGSPGATHGRVREARQFDRAKFLCTRASRAT